MTAIFILNSLNAPDDSILNSSRVDLRLQGAVPFVRLEGQGAVPFVRDDSRLQDQADSRSTLASLPDDSNETGSLRGSNLSAEHVDAVNRIIRRATDSYRESLRRQAGLPPSDFPSDLSCPRFDSQPDPESSPQVDLQSDQQSLGNPIEPNVEPNAENAEFIEMNNLIQAMRNETNQKIRPWLELIREIKNANGIPIELKLPLIEACVEEMEKINDFPTQGRTTIPRGGLFKVTSFSYASIFIRAAGRFAACDYYALIHLAIEFSLLRKLVIAYSGFNDQEN